jgi:hypothetical protein
MDPGRALNRRFHARPLDASMQRWALESSDDAALGAHVRVLLQTSEPTAMPGPVEIQEIRGTSQGTPPRGFVIHRAGGALPVGAHGVHVHEIPGSRYQAVLPRYPVPVIERWLWKLLLASLRVPGVFALVSRARRRRGSPAVA